VGARYSHAMSDTVTPYVGAAYEHEFDGKAEAASYGYNIDAPSMRGGTGIAEVGMTLRPSRNFPATVDIGIQGSLGKRAGVSGRLRLGWTF
jgi:outer membrane autotransporter protein